MNEDEWETLEKYVGIYHKAKEKVGHPDFFFNCGASSGRYDSWGWIRFLKLAIDSPTMAYATVPRFNENFNDTKDMGLLMRPHKEDGSIRVTYKIKFHEDIDPNFDYCSDPYIIGIFSSIPEGWDLEPTNVLEIMNEYDPTVLLPKEFGVSCWCDENELYAIDPQTEEAKLLGKRVRLFPTEDIPKRATEEEICLGDRYAFLNEEEPEGMQGILML